MSSLPRTATPVTGPEAEQSVMARLADYAELTAELEVDAGIGDAAGEHRDDRRRLGVERVGDDLLGEFAPGDTVEIGEKSGHLVFGKARR